MGLEAATYINQLNSANPVGAADPKAQGDDHLRLIKSTLQASFPGITGAMTRTQTQLNLIGTDGTAALPSYTFTLDLDTGMYRIGANVLGFTAGGLNNFFYDGTTIGVPDGAVGTPGIRFNSDGDTGIYRFGVNGISISVGGVERFRVDGNSVLEVHSLGEHGFEDGTQALPGLTFNSDIDTGVYRVGANTLGISTGGALTIQFDTLGAYNINGTNANPAYTFTSDANTGMYRIGPDILGFAVGGSEVMRLDNAATGNFTFAANQLLNLTGTAALPVYSFTSDPDTGLYRDTANQIGIALGGVTAGQIAQGSFAPTFTGYSAAPGATTWFYQRIGHHVILQVPTFSGTSNATSLTVSNLPAIIQPTRQVVGQLNYGVDNSLGFMGAVFSIAAGSAVISFAHPTNIVWTAANLKGIGSTAAFPNAYTQIVYSTQ